MLAVGLGMESLDSRYGEDFEVREKKGTLTMKIFRQNPHIPICILNLEVLVIMRLPV